MSGSSLFHASLSCASIWPGDGAAYASTAGARVRATGSAEKLATAAPRNRVRRVCKRDGRTAWSVTGMTPLLPEPPTGLADGFGPGKTPYRDPDRAAGFTPGGALDPRLVDRFG